MRYIEIKIHHLIKERDFDEIIVIGEYDRVNSILHRGEKTDKQQNWQRPTAVFGKDDKQLIIKCYPGREYVKHYANLIASYLKLKGNNHTQVYYMLPDENACWDPILNSGIASIPKGDIVVVGHGLEEISQTENWQGNDQFLWAQKNMAGKTVTFIICQHSFWGDILERIATVLIDLGYKHIFYTAKVGGINRELLPNESLATGSVSIVEGELVEWKNWLDGVEYPNLNYGKHFNSGSVVLENKDWVEHFKNFDFVDSDTGFIARAAKNHGARFGYVDFVSNSLTVSHDEDLSNERLPLILEKREKLKQDIRKIFEHLVHEG